MKTLIIALLITASTAFAQPISSSTGGSLILPSVNLAVTGQVNNFPLPAASGSFGFLIDDNATVPGAPYAEDAIPGAGFSYNPVTKVLDVRSAPARSTVLGVSHSLNSAFQVSTTRDSLVSYTVQVAATISLTSGQTGTISIQTSPDNITYTTAGSFTNGNTGSLTIGLNLTNTQAGQIQAYVPSGYYVKLVSSGAATSTYTTGQETLL